MKKSSGTTCRISRGVGWMGSQPQSKFPDKEKIGQRRTKGSTKKGGDDDGGEREGSEARREWMDRAGWKKRGKNQGIYLFKAKKV